MWVAFFEQKEAWEWEPGLPSEELEPASGAGRGCPAPSPCFLGTKAETLDAFSVLWAMALAFRRAASNDNSTVFLWSQTSAEKNALRFLFDSHHLWKASISEFLIWFRVLESPPLGQSPRTQPFSWSRSLRSCLHYTGCAVCAQAQTTLYWQRAPHWFTMSCSHFTVYHISCILVCSHGMSSIHDAISWVCLGGFYLTGLQVAQGQTGRTCWRMSCRIAPSSSSSLSC